MKTHRIAAIPGDGIGVEVIAAGIEVLEALAKRDGSFGFAFDHFDWGSDYYKRTGLMMPADGREQIKDHDAIFFGAVGAPDVPDHVTLWGLRLAICQPSTNTPMSARRAFCRHHLSPAFRFRPGTRLGDRARELRGRICRRRRPRSQGLPRGGRRPTSR